MNKFHLKKIFFTNIIIRPIHPIKQMIQTEIEEKPEITPTLISLNQEPKKEKEPDMNLINGGYLITTEHFIAPLDIPREKPTYQGRVNFKNPKNSPYVSGSFTSSSFQFYGSEKKIWAGPNVSRAKITDYFILDYKLMRQDKNILATTAQDRLIIWCKFPNL